MRAARWASLGILLVGCQNIVGVRDGTLLEPAGAAASGGGSGGGGRGNAGGSAPGDAGAAGLSTGGSGGSIAGGAGMGLGGAGDAAGAGGTLTGGQAGNAAAGGGGSASGFAGDAGNAGSAGTSGAGGTGAVIPGGAPPIGWVRRYGTVSDDSVTIGASDGAHGVILGGRLTSTMTFAPAVVVPVKGMETRFFLRVDEGGNVVWARSFTAQTTTFYAMASLPDGGALVAASIEGKFTPAEGDITAGYVAPPNTSARAPALLRLEADGRLRWARRLATTLGDGTSVIRTAEGIFFAGTYVGSCDLGNGKILAGQADAVDLFVAKIDEETGATLDGYGLVGAEATGVPIVVARSAGAAVLLPCTKPFTVDGAGAPLACEGVAFVPLGGTGATPAVADAKSFVIPQAGALRAARALGGEIYFATRFEGIAKVAGTSLASGGPQRILFVRTNDAGEAQAAVGLGGPGTHLINALVPDATEGVVFAGSAKGITAYEGGTVNATPAGQSNAFLGRLRPSLSIAWLGLAPGAGSPLSQQANVLISDELSVFAAASMSNTFFIDGALTALGQRDIVLLRLLR